MCDENDCHIRFLLDSVERRLDNLLRRSIQRRRGFVKNQYAGFTHKTSCDCDSLLLATGELLSFFAALKYVPQDYFNSLFTCVSNLSAMFKINSCAEAIFVAFSIASSTSSTSNGPYKMFFWMLRANRTGSCWTTVTKRCKLVTVLNFKVWNKD